MCFLRNFLFELKQLQWRCLKMFISWIHVVDMDACHMCHVYMYPMIKCFGHICCVWSALLSP